MNEEKIKKYVVGGGELFIVTGIGRYRDGGTGVIDTTKRKFYIDKLEKTLHYNYPTTEDNLIEDELLINYILDSVESYVKKQESEMERNKNLFKTLKEKY